MNITKEVSTLGQSLWLDNLSRSLIRDGTLPVPATIQRHRVAIVG